MWHPSGLQPQCCFPSGGQWWLFQQTEGISGLASTWRICHDMSDISWALWASQSQGLWKLSLQGSKVPHKRILGFKWYNTWREDYIQHCLCTCSSTLPSASWPKHQRIYPFSSAPLSPANFPIQTVSLCLCHLLPYYSLDSWLPASCQLLAVPPVNPKVSLFLLKDISFDRKRTTSSCCSSSSATTGEKVWLHCGN